jgi:hypothetical protein
MMRASNTSARTIATVVFLMLALVPAMLAVAALWILPVGSQGADRTALSARDYTDMWAAGYLTAAGQGDVLFDLARFNAALQSKFGAGFPHQLWPYPPPIMLLAVPLSMLPLLPGFLLYTGGSMALLWLALHCCGLPRAVRAAVLFSPAVADNALAGQNGSLITALLLGGLSLVHRRPLAAGAILGALVIKPQFALLVPLCLIATGTWRALGAMILSAAVLVVVSGFLFGIDAWTGFFVHTRPMIAAMLGAPWQALPAQQIFASPLMAARAAGTSLDVAYGIQTAVTLLAAALVWWLWRTADVEPIPRLALTGLLAVLAAPWAHTYDMIPLAVMTAVLVANARRNSPILFGVAWIWPGAVAVWPIPLPLSVASIGSVVLRAWQEIMRRVTEHRRAASISADVSSFQQSGDQAAAFKG